MSQVEYDYIVVGSGSVGGIVASRLSEDPSCKVLLLEAGPDFPLDALPPDVADGLAISIGHHDWPSMGEMHPGRTIPYGAGKLVGGSSATNGTMALRGYPADFARWAQMGNHAWAFEKVLPYFRRLENDLDFQNPDHGNEGPVPIVRFAEAELTPISRAFRDAAVALGYPWDEDLNSTHSSTGVGAVPMNRRGRLRVSTKVAYIDPAQRRPNFTLRANCLVNRVLFEGRRAVGVEVLEGASKRSIAGGEVILSAGALHTPPLLLRSGVGPIQDLEGFGIPIVHHNPNVGRNLYEHAQACLGLIPRERGFNREFPDIQVLVNYSAEGSPYSDDMQIFAVNRLLLGRFPDWPAPHGVDLLIGLMTVLNQPESRGFITLQGADATVEPRIVLNLMTHPSDRARLRDAMRRCWQLAHTEPLRQLWEGVAYLDAAIVEDDERLDRYCIDHSATIWHPVGTCKMGPADDPTAVADQFGRVHGVHRLRVADASLFPTPTSRNPNLTCFMAGEALADWIRAGRG